MFAVALARSHHHIGGRCDDIGHGPRAVLLRAAVRVVQPCCDPRAFHIRRQQLLRVAALAVCLRPKLILLELQGLLRLQALLSLFNGGGCMLIEAVAMQDASRLARAAGRCQVLAVTAEVRHHALLVHRALL